MPTANIVVAAGRDLAHLGQKLGEVCHAADRYTPFREPDMYGFGLPVANGEITVVWAITAMLEKGPIGSSVAFCLAKAGKVRL